MHFGMRFSSSPVKAASDDLAFACDHTTHRRIGVDGKSALFGQAQGLGHTAVIVDRERQSENMVRLRWT